MIVNLTTWDFILIYDVDNRWCHRLELVIMADTLSILLKTFDNFSDYFMTLNKQFMVYNKNTLEKEIEAGGVSVDGCTPPPRK